MMVVIIWVIGIALSLSILSSISNGKGLSKFEQQQLIHECELQYGEICYKCEERIGDPTGEARLCESCLKKDEI
jgi:hypothetical protein